MGNGLPFTLICGFRAHAGIRKRRVFSMGREQTTWNTITGFTSVARTWKSGDTVHLSLPADLRLEPINAAHPEMAALIYGPLVLFALTEQAPVVTRLEALAAKKQVRRNGNSKRHRLRFLWCHLHMLAMMPIGLICTFQPKPFALSETLSLDSPEILGALSEGKIYVSHYLSDALSHECSPASRCQDALRRLCLLCLFETEPV